jgi:hypothetical protein
VLGRALHDLKHLTAAQYLRRRAIGIAQKDSVAHEMLIAKTM